MHPQYHRVAAPFDPRVAPVRALKSVIMLPSCCDDEALADFALIREIDRKDRLSER